jgi:hypothetical protein
MSKKHQAKSGSKSPRKVVELRPGNQSPAPAGALPERVAALEQNQLGIVNMFNQNMGAFKGGMLAVDAMLHVQQRVLHDLVGQMLGGNPLTVFSLRTRLGEDGKPEGVSVYLDEAGMVDFPKYIREYYGCVGFTEFLISLKEWRKTHHVVRLPDGSLDVISVADVIEEARAEQAAEEMASAIAGPQEDVEEVTTVFGGDGGAS